jgi:hypothetical protein
MIALKKLKLVLVAFLFINVNGMAQDSRVDIGALISSSNQARLGIEFRKPLGEHYKFKLGATYGSSYNYFGALANGEIISVNDSLIVERISESSYNQGGIRIGAERRFKTSMFSVGADLNINYRQRLRINYNRNTYLGEDGIWSSQSFPTSNFSPFEDPAASRITEHFIVPSFRVSFNMDVPLGKSFLLNLYAAGSFGAPIYMGNTGLIDPESEFIGSPPSIIDFDTQAGIGLRYLIGKSK